VHATYGHSGLPTLMLPLLTLLADGKERSFSQVPPPLADQFQLPRKIERVCSQVAASRRSATVSTGPRST
jgi:hypothetical protein